MIPRSQWAPVPATLVPRFPSFEPTGEVNDPVWATPEDVLRFRRLAECAYDRVYTWSPATRDAYHARLTLELGRVGVWRFRQVRPATQDLVRTRARGYLLWTLVALESVAPRPNSLDGLRGRVWFLQSCLDEFLRWCPTQDPALKRDVLEWMHAEIRGCNAQLERDYPHRAAVERINTAAPARTPHWERRAAAEHRQWQVRQQTPLRVKATLRAMQSKQGPKGRYAVNQEVRFVHVDRVVTAIVERVHGNRVWLRDLDDHPFRFTVDELRHVEA